MSDENGEELPTAKELVWDSQHFALRIAQVTSLDLDEPKKLLNWAARTSMDCVYLRTNPQSDILQKAEEIGFSCRGIHLDFEMKTKPNDVVARAAAKDDAVFFSKTVRESYGQSRFFQEPRFAPELAAALFEQWIFRATEGTFDDAMLVIDDQDQRGGFVTVREIEKGVRIGLLGVNALCRGQGIGRNLVRAASAWAEARGHSALFVATQGQNLAAARLYESAGGRLVSLQMDYHWWPKSEGQ